MVARTAPGLPLLQVSNLRTEFRTEHGTVTAVDGVGFTVHQGEVFGLVGESGSGKSATGLSIMGLIDPPGRVTGGCVLLGGRDLRTLDQRQLREIRGNRVSMVFQDPMTTLHPMLRIGTQMVDAILAHRKVRRRQAWTEARDALGRVGIASPSERMSSYPHQLSGGMRQRVAIAIALLNRPALVIADEPTTGLDVTIQAQILYEVQKLVSETGTALIWITHDLAVVSNLADTVAVMYAGNIVEQGPVVEVLESPAHPYTAGLIASAPANNIGPRGRLAQIPGSIGSALVAEGCRFMPRCGQAQAACRDFPAMRAKSPGHEARCVLV